MRVCGIVAARAICGFFPLDPYSQDECCPRYGTEVENVYFECVHTKAIASKCFMITRTRKQKIANETP